MCHAISFLFIVPYKFFVKKSYRIFLSFCLVIPLLLTAQKQLLFKSLTTANGLPSNYVLSVKQDMQGYIWIGTDKGLARFDGYKWQTWDTENGLPGNYINLIEEDKHGGIWIHIPSVGFYHFDGIKWVQYLKNIEGISYQRRVLTKDGSLLLISQVANTNNIKGLLLSRTNPSLVEVVFSFTGNPENLQVAADEQKLLFINYNNKEVASKAINFSGKWELQPSTYFFNYEDHNYFYTNDSTSLVKNLFYLIPNSTTNEKKLLSTSLSSPQVFCKGNLYFTGMINGLYKAGENKLTNIRSKDGLGTDYINDLAATKEGVLMIGSMGQGLLFYNNDAITKYVLNNSSIKKILCEDNGMYVLSGDNVYYQSLQSDTFKYTGIHVANATTLTKKGNSLFVGSYTGWKEYYINKNQLFFVKEVIHSYGNSGIYISDNFTYASTYGQGILRYKKNKFIDSLNLPFTIVEKIFPINNGFAASSYDNGVVFWNINKNTFHHLTKKELLSNTVYNVFEDRDDIWISTRFGINHFVTGSVQEKFTSENGFKGTHAVYSFKDSADRLWVLSDTYLHLKKGNRLIPIKSYQTSIDEKSVAGPVEFNKKTQLLYIGTNKNLLIADIWKIFSDSNIVIPSIESIAVDGAKNIDEKFDVSSSFEKILFKFATASPRSISGYESRYKLEGLDDTWHILPDSLIVTFSGLRPGKYALLLQTENADGFLSPVKTVAIFRVKPPFWSNIWFIALCIILGSLITGLIIWRQQQMKLKRLKLLDDALFKQKQQATVQMLTAEENERKRIALDLHDGIGQMMTAAWLNLQALTKSMGRPDSEEALLVNKTANLVGESCAEIRHVSHNMMPNSLSKKGLINALGEFTNQVDAKVLSITLHADEEKLELDQTTEIILYRIIQEAVNNVIRHANASELDISILNDEDGLDVLIEDNGEGFNTSVLQNSPGIGIQNIQSRIQYLNGTVEWNNTGNGTVVAIHIPYTNE